MSEEADAIRELELRLIDGANRRSPEMVESLLAHDFVEFGASGRIYSKASVLDAMRRDTSAPPEMADFSAKRVGDGVVLATYQTVRRDPEGALSSKQLRCSLWRHAAGNWQLVFHQGTSVPL